MDNRTKQCLATLEARVLRLENILFDITNAGLNNTQPLLVCNQCGYSDPINNGVICSQVDCCMGLNPNDDQFKTGI